MRGGRRGKKGASSLLSCVCFFKKAQNYIGFFNIFLSEISKTHGFFLGGSFLVKHGGDFFLQLKK
jgi:hypothetical protein